LMACNGCKPSRREPRRLAPDRAPTFMPVNDG
jgi:hypothetical protein